MHRVGANFSQPFFAVLLLRQAKMHDLPLPAQISQWLAQKGDVDTGGIPHSGSPRLSIMVSLFHRRGRRVTQMKSENSPHV